MGKTIIDVGAYAGAYSLNYATEHPGDTVYAFEPNLEKAYWLSKRAPANYWVMPCAVSDYNGVAQFHLTACDLSSSILPVDPDCDWIEGEGLRLLGFYPVPVLRLDTFLDHRGYNGPIDLLKVDAQGADLRVLEGLGGYIYNVQLAIVEVAVTPVQPYKGAHTKAELLAFMAAHGFRLTHTESQSHYQEENLTFARE